MKYSVALFYRRTDQIEGGKSVTKERLAQYLVNAQNEDDALGKGIKKGLEEFKGFDLCYWRTINCD